MTNSGAAEANLDPSALEPKGLARVAPPSWSESTHIPPVAPPVSTPGWSRRRPDVFGVIEVGSDRARLDIFRRDSDGSFQVVWHDEESLGGGFPFATDPRDKSHPAQPRLSDQRLVVALRRFQRVCGRHHVTVGAVAHGSDSLNNHPDTLPRLFRMTGVALKQVSDRDTARLLCLGVLRGHPTGGKSLVIDVGPEATLVVLADGEEPVALWRLGVGTNDGDGGEGPSALRALRGKVRQSLRQTRLDAVRGAAARSLTVRDRLEGGGAATGRAARVILEEIAAHLRLDGIRAVGRGLREGILYDLGRQTGPTDA